MTLSSIEHNSQPRALVASDLNDDAQLDIIVANTGDNTVGVFLAYEDGTFQSQITYTTGSESKPNSLAIGDFNNDSRADVIVANYGTNSFGVLLGYGDGTLNTVRLRSLGSSRPVSITTVDLNGDTFLDLIFVNYDTSSILILFGYGDASFTVPIEYSTGYDSHPLSVVAADLNQDKQLDLIVANSGTSNIAIFIGCNNGSFSLEKIYSTGTQSQPQSVAVGDMNGDHRLDIIVVNYKTSSVGTFFGNDNGTFTPIILSFINSKFHPYSMVIADFNGDKILDVAVTNPNNDSVHVLTGFKNGSFINSETYSTGFQSSPISLVFGDFNHDNELDLVALNNGTENILVLLRYISKAFSPQTIYSTGYNSQPRGVTLGDINNDGILDIVAGLSPAHISIILGHGNGTFNEHMSFQEGSSSRPYSFALKDFNNDSFIDIAATNSGTDMLAMVLGYGNGSFGDRKIYSTGTHSTPYSITAGYIDNNQLFDVAVTTFQSGNVIIFLDYRHEMFREQITLPIGNGSTPTSIVLCDFDQDNSVDIVTANYGTSNVGIFYGYGNGSFSTQMQMKTGTNSGPRSIGTMDLNSDAILDIAVTNQFDDNVGIFIGHGNRSFGHMTTYYIGTGANPTSLAFGDFNNDMIIDIAMTNSGTNEIAIIFGYGNGTFGMLTKYPTGDGSTPLSIAAGYFNHDEWLDIAVGNTLASSIGVFLGLDNMYFARRFSYTTGSGPHPRLCIAHDFNNDALLDLLIVNSAHADVSIRYGYGNGSFADEIKYPVEKGSNPNSAVAADFNNDSKVDIVVTNTMNDSITLVFGFDNGKFNSSQTISTGINSRPSFVIAGDLNNDGRLDLSVVNENAGTVGVFISFDYATFTNQSVYSTGDHSYPMSVVIGDLNNDSYHDAVIANYGNDNIVIFLGDGDGYFTQKTTISTGTGSSPYMVTLNDFNHDGVPDIAVANVGSNRIGIFLGYGNGTFKGQILCSNGNGSNPRAIGVSDFNRDGLLDMAVVSSATSNVAILLGYGNGTFKYTVSMHTGNKASPHAIAVGDFNCDTLSDIVVANTGINNIGVFLGYGNGSFAGQMIFSTGDNSFPQSIIVTDFNNDTFLDIAVANTLTNKIGIFFGLGNGSFRAQIEHSSGTGSVPRMLATFDLNQDGRPDIAVANEGTNTIGFMFGYGDGNFTDCILFSTGPGSQPSAIAIGNFDSDSRSDIIVANYLGSDIMVFLRTSSQTFLSMKEYSTGNDSYPQSMALADFNNDSYLDVVVANSGSDNIGIRFGKGDGTLLPLIIYTTGYQSKPCSVAVGDFNNDNLSDIVIANAATNNFGIVFGHGDGTFSSMVMYECDGCLTPSSVVATDFNKDGFIDIAVLNTGSLNVFVLYGNGNGTFENSNSYSLGFRSLVYSLSLGDLDNDTWIDLVVANYGTNAVNILLQQCS